VQQKQVIDIQLEDVIEQVVAGTSSRPMANVPAQTPELIRLPPRRQPAPGGLGTKRFCWDFSQPIGFDSERHDECTRAHAQRACSGFARAKVDQWSKLITAHVSLSAPDRAVRKQICDEARVMEK
jgi:hypothetical protein